MKLLLTLWITTIIGLAGTYNHVIDLQETIKIQDFKVMCLQNELNELENKYDSEYMDQIKKWIPPYTINDSRLRMGQISYTEYAK